MKFVKKGTKKVNLKASTRRLATGVATGDHIPKHSRYKDNKRQKNKRIGRVKDFDI